MVRKHYYNFRYSANMLKIRSRGFDRAQYSNVNENNYFGQQFCENQWLQRRIQNPVKHLRWNFFREVVTGFKGKLRILPNI